MPKKVPKDLVLPVACCDTLIRKATGLRVGDDAGIEMANVLAKIGSKISVAAAALAKHRGKVTIKEKDVRMAFESLKI